MSEVKRGRPSQGLNVRVNFYLTERQYIKITKMAHKKRQTQSVVIRGIIDNA